MTDQEKKLRTGFTTGTAAAAASKGALTSLLEKHPFDDVTIELLTGKNIRIPIHSCTLESEHTAVCTVIKDAGDDPDVTNGAEIGARVSVRKASVNDTLTEPVIIKGGKGVGRVTKPGLEISPGEPAINPGPRRMITQAIRDILLKNDISLSVTVEVFVPEGEKLARKTLNARLGILGGISILGTTGIVTPMSHEAYTATIQSALSVARACGQNRVVLTTGRRSERYAQYLWPSLSEEAFIQIGDYFQFSLQTASEIGFEKLSLVVFFGKAIKMAQGMPHTHAAKASMPFKTLAQWVMEACHQSELAAEVEGANTARQIFDMIRLNCPGAIERVGHEIVHAARQFCGERIGLQSIILDYEGRIAFDSDSGRGGGRLI